MAGKNLTGAPSTSDYNLGRGALYFANLVSSLPSRYRHLGNSPEFNISVEVETLEHQSSLTGLKVTDKEVIISQKVSVSVTLDEINDENLAVFFSGEVATFGNDVALAGFSEHVMIAAAEVEQGRWYDIVDSSGVRVYDIDEGNLTVESPDTTAQTLNTDYTVDEEFGRIFIVVGGGIATGADDVLVTLAADAGTKEVDEVRALTQTNVTGALKFIGENPANNDESVEYQFHQISLKAEGDFAQISDEFTTMQFTGTAESNTTADADSPTLTIRSVNETTAT